MKTGLKTLEQWQSKKRNENVREKLKVLSDPLIEFLNEFHPHMQIVITHDKAEMFEWAYSVKNDSHLKD